MRSLKRVYPFGRLLCGRCHIPEPLRAWYETPIWAIYGVISLEIGLEHLDKLVFLARLFDKPHFPFGDTVPKWIPKEHINMLHVWYRFLPVLGTRYGP